MNAACLHIAHHGPISCRACCASCVRAQRSAGWKARHAELVRAREGLYLEILDEDALAAVKASTDPRSVGGAIRDVFRRKGRRGSVD